MKVHPLYTAVAGAVLEVPSEKLKDSEPAATWGGCSMRTL